MRSMEEQIEERTSRLQRIQELKEQLYNTQAEVIKTMEGYPVDDPDIMAKRQLWREQIATLNAMTDAEYEEYVEPEVETYVKEVPSADDIVSQLKELVQSQVAEMTDEQAKKVPALFPLWTDHKNGDSIAAGVREWYKSSLYKCIVPHNWQSDWAPDVATSLWVNVSEESQEEDGSREHPYQWEQGMTSYNGKYYTEDGILYLCTRDSGAPLHHPIASLINLYFVVAD